MATKKMSKSPYQQLITKPELSFWIPILSSSVIIALSWANLTTRIELLTQKVDNLTEQSKTIVAKYSDLESRYGTLTLKVQRLETIEGLGPIK